MESGKYLSGVLPGESNLEEATTAETQALHSSTSVNTGKADNKTITTSLDSKRNIGR